MQQNRKTQIEIVLDADRMNGLELISEKLVHQPGEKIEHELNNKLKKIKKMKENIKSTKKSQTLLHHNEAKLAHKVISSKIEHLKKTHPEIEFIYCLRSTARDSKDYKFANTTVVGVVSKSMTYNNFSELRIGYSIRNIKDPFIKSEGYYYALARALDNSKTFVLKGDVLNGITVGPFISNHQKSLFKKIADDISKKYEIIYTKKITYKDGKEVPIWVNFFEPNGEAEVKCSSYDDDLNF